MYSYLEKLNFTILMWDCALAHAHFFNQIFIFSLYIYVSPALFRVRSILYCIPNRVKVNSCV